MNIGMLWFNNDTKTSTKDKILGALEYYKNKYGVSANRVYLHPSMLIESWDGVTITASRSVMPNHFWIGTELTAIQQEIKDSEWDAIDSEEVREFMDRE